MRPGLLVAHNRVLKIHLHLRCRRQLHAELRLKRMRCQLASKPTMQSQTPLVRREVSVNVFESRIFGRWTQRSFRVIAVASLFLTLTAMGMAQSSIQTITADDGAQAGSQPAGATLEGNISDAKGGLIG